MIAARIYLIRCYAKNVKTDLTADEKKQLRQIAAHNDVVGALIFDPLAERLEPQGRVVVSQGELQIELDLESGSVHQPLSDFFSSRLQSVAELLRKSAIPLLAFDTAEDTLRQLSRQLGNTQRAHR